MVSFHKSVQRHCFFIPQQEAAAVQGACAAGHMGRVLLNAACRAAWMREAPPGLKSSVVYPHGHQAAQVGSSSLVQTCSGMRQTTCKWHAGSGSARMRSSSPAGRRGSQPASKLVRKQAVPHRSQHLAAGGAGGGGGVPQAQPAIDVSRDDGIQRSVLHLLGRQLARLPVAHGDLRGSEGSSGRRDRSHGMWNGMACLPDKPPRQQPVESAAAAPLANQAMQAAATRCAVCTGGACNGGSLQPTLRSLGGWKPRTCFVSAPRPRPW